MNWWPGGPRAGRTAPWWRKLFRVVLRQVVGFDEPDAFYSILQGFAPLFLCAWPPRLKPTDIGCSRSISMRGLALLGRQNRLELSRRYG